MHSQEGALLAGPRHPWKMLVRGQGQTGSRTRLIRGRKRSEEPGLKLQPCCFRTMGLWKSEPSPQFLHLSVFIKPGRKSSLSCLCPKVAMGTQ